MARGGKRPNSGAKAESIRPSLTAYWTKEDIADYFDWLKREYKTQPTLAKFVGEQLMGKAVQPLTGEGGGPIQISGVEIKVRK